MSEKIEINTLIVKHENKCKGCRFEMIDVEDPLFEFGSPLKRVLIDNRTGKTYDDISKLVSLLNEQQSIINSQNELLDEIFTVFQKYGIETGYNKRILEVALKELRGEELE